VGTLHELRVCHRDLKPDNILLHPDASRKSGFYLTVVDFNVSVDLEQTPLITGATGLKAWSAPETRSVGGYNEKADIYSLGCLMQLLLTGAKPDSPFMPMHMATQPEAAKDLAKQLLNENYQERPSCKEALEHRWLAQSS
jgi:serine/threonine protein kinase